MYASSALRRGNLFNYIYNAHAIEPLQRRKSAILLFHFVSVAHAQFSVNFHTCFFQPIRGRVGHVILSRDNAHEARGAQGIITILLLCSQ